MSDPVKITFDSACGSGLKIAGFFNDSSAPVVKGVVQICHGMSEYYGRYPCHRVVNHAGRTAPGFRTQKELLLAEGVGFRDNGCVDLKKYLWDC